VLINHHCIPISIQVFFQGSHAPSNNSLLQTGEAEEGSPLDAAQDLLEGSLMDAAPGAGKGLSVRLPLFVAAANTLAQGVSARLEEGASITEAIQELQDEVDCVDKVIRV